MIEYRLISGSTNYSREPMEAIFGLMRKSNADAGRPPLPEPTEAHYNSLWRYLSQEDFYTVIALADGEPVGVQIAVVMEHPFTLHRTLQDVQTCVPPGEHFIAVAKGFHQAFEALAELAKCTRLVRTATAENIETLGKFYNNQGYALEFFYLVKEVG